MKTADNLMVSPINHDKLEDYMNTLNMDKPRDVVYLMGSDSAVVLDDNYDAINVITNDDCVHVILGKGAIPVDFNISLVYDVPFYIKKDNGDGTSNRSIFPSFTLRMPLQEIVNYYCTEPVSLKEFMGKRYNYNPRVRGNMIELLKLFKDII